MSYKIEEIEGIGPANAEKLASAEIDTTDDLLEKCAAKSGRKAIAEQADISEKLILEWTNMADLMRISGVGPEYAELLEAAGVDTVKELRNRNAANLAAKMKEINDEKALTRSIPGTGKVEKWVEEAKSLDAITTH